MADKKSLKYSLNLFVNYLNSRKRLPSVKIIFNNLEEFVIRAIASDKDPVLIGRDIINKWSLFLKGRSKTFEIS